MRIEAPSICQETQTLQSNQNVPADFADEKEKGPATLGNSLAELSKVRHTFTIGSDCPIPG